MNVKEIIEGLKNNTLKTETLISFDGTTSMIYYKDEAERAEKVREWHKKEREYRIALLGR